MSASEPNGARERRQAYWRANLRLVAVLLLVWFSVSFGAGILFADVLDGFRIPGTGFPLGFFMAQQGSIYIFVALIFIYVLAMRRLDRRFGAQESFRDKGKGI